ncbi:putative F-box protein At1g47790 [Silene latifolia]|uniref:putative F-box protein At1g47790 n=1 Tax=Silene latifolia TaxID=37657 RepID=UPI003D76FA85
MSDLSLTSPEIPLKIESLWPEILKRVPVSQLGICMCVSKKWYSLITSPVFISSHIKFISQTSCNLFLLRSFTKKNPQKNPKEFYYICSDTDAATVQTLETLTLKTFICPFKTRNGLQFRMVGSVNGVIYLSDDYFSTRYTFILWNPLVNCFIHLPKPRACFDLIGPYMTASGFGYDSVNDDFKVIRIVYPQRSDGLDETPPRAELYSVNEGKWRWVSGDNVHYCTFDKEWKQCFLKGSVHWVAYERFGEENNASHKSNLLLLFNVEKEKFMMMKLPLELREVCPLGLLISECQGMLCVNHYEMTEMVIGELAHYNLWVKKEYNKFTSWIKVASVDIRHSVVHEAIYLKNNGELLAASKSRHLLSYDPKTSKVVVLALGHPALYEACSFVESLAFLNKDCKNMRRFLLEEDENGSSDDEELSPEKLQSSKIGKLCSYLNQMDKFRRQF